MPRIAKPPTAEAVQARIALSAFLEREGLSGNAIASMVGVGQSTVSRFLTGRTKTITPGIQPVLDYATIEVNTGITRVTDALDNPRVREALGHGWDGTPESAEILARLIEAIGPIVTTIRASATRSKR